MPNSNYTAANSALMGGGLLRHGRSHFDNDSCSDKIFSDAGERMRLN